MKGQLANVRSFTHHRSQFVSAACSGMPEWSGSQHFFIQSMRFYAVVCYIKKAAAKQNTQFLSTYCGCSVYTALVPSSVIRQYEKVREKKIVIFIIYWTMVLWLLMSSLHLLCDRTWSDVSTFLTYCSHSLEVSMPMGINSAHCLQTAVDSPLWQLQRKSRPARREEEKEKIQHETTWGLCLWKLSKKNHINVGTVLGVGVDNVYIKSTRHHAYMSVCNVWIGLTSTKKHHTFNFFFCLIKLDKKRQVMVSHGDQEMFQNVDPNIKRLLTCTSY